MVQVAQRNLLVACMRVAGDLKLCRVVTKVVSCPALPLHNYHLSSPRRRSSHPLGGWRPASGGSSRPSCRWRHYLWCGSGFCVRILSVYQDSFAVSVSFCRVRILLTVSGSFRRIRILLTVSGSFCRIRILLPYQDSFAVSVSFWPYQDPFDRTGSFCRIRSLLPYQDPFAVSGSFCRIRILLPYQDSFAVSVSFCRVRIPFAVSGSFWPYQDPFAVSRFLCRIRILVPYHDPFALSGFVCRMRIRLLNPDPYEVKRSLRFVRIRSYKLHLNRSGSA